jgi:hypothetical protein
MKGICKQKCFFDSRVWEPGEEIVTDNTLPESCFDIVETVKAQKKVPRKKAAPKPDPKVLADLDPGPPADDPETLGDLG